MTRIPFADPETLPPEARALVEGSRVTVTGVVAQAADSAAPLAAMLAGIRKSPDLDPVLRELVILRAAASADSDYELVQHEAIARDLGVPDEQAEAAKSGRPLEGRDGLVVALVDDLHQGRRPSDDRYAEVLGVVSPRALVEAILLYGLYTTTARVIEAAGLPPEPAAGATEADRGRA
jgi:AhpD family alkylhydroperoxidase